MSMFYQIKNFILIGIAFSFFYLTSSQSTEQQMYQAIKFGLSRIINTYAEQNINLTYIDTFDNKTFLQCAVTHDNIDAVEQLLALEVDINQQDWFGGTALHTAVSRMEREPNLEIIKLLLTHPFINTKIQNKLGRTAHACAQFYEHSKAIALLENHEQLLKNKEKNQQSNSENKYLALCNQSIQNNRQANHQLNKIKEKPHHFWFKKYF